MAALEIIVVAVLILLNGYLAMCEIAIVAAASNAWPAAATPALEGYDEPEILRSSSHQFCLTSAEAGHY